MNSGRPLRRKRMNKILRQLIRETLLTEAAMKPQPAIGEPKLRQVVREMAQFAANRDPEDMQVVGLEFKRAAEICRALGEKPLLTRGFQATSQAGSHYITTEGPAEKGRMATEYAVRPSLRALVDGLTERFGLGSLVYCGVVGGKYVKLFGTEHIVFPTEPFKVIYNPEIDDSGSWTKNNSAADVPAAIEGYVEGWPELGYRGEVILDTPAYYLINLDWASKWFQDLARHDREGIPEPREPVKSSRDRERAEIEKRYGRSPQMTTGQSSASRADKMMAVKTYAELSPYFEWMWQQLGGRKERA